MAPSPKTSWQFVLLLLKASSGELGLPQNPVKYLRLVIFDFTKIFVSKRAPGSRSATLALARSRTYKNFSCPELFKNYVDVSIHSHPPQQHRKH